MSRHHSHINTAIQLIESFKGDEPFANFIKHFFASEKKFGSKDRKQIASLCFSYFRLGLALDKKPSEKNLLTAFFLCNTEPIEMIKALKPEWEEMTGKPLEEKLNFLHGCIELSGIFPFKKELNENIDFNNFCRSFLIQPDLFTRIRPKQKINTLKKIKKSGLPYVLLNDDNCSEFASGTKIDDLLEPDNEIVIQDYNSQKVLDYLQQNKDELAAKNSPPGTLAVWDCCAASGGKSILLTDILQQKISLTVSDIRPASILNLHQRFKKASINEYQYFITDIGNMDGKVPLSSYDIIICDAPCTGSGTWSRTPEQLYFFKESTIGSYAEKQKKIADNATLHLKQDGIFVYITCSVFEKENEAIAKYIQKELQMEMIHMENLYGYNNKADSMFVAIFKNK